MFEVETLSYIKTILPFEWLMLGLYLLVILGISFGIQYFRIRREPIYKYYLGGMAAKLGSSVVFCMVYIYYYHGGDTVSYYETSRAMTNLLYARPDDFFQMLFSKGSITTYMLFDDRTGFPWPYMFYDAKTCMVAKLLVPVLMVSFKSYLVSSVVLAWIAYTGVWQLFKMFVRYFPTAEKRMAIAALYIPSVLFWGSGILKDTFTLAAACWFIVSFNFFFIEKKVRIRALVVLLISSYLLLAIKPYILIALLPGGIVWIFYNRIIRIRIRILRYSAIPLIFLAAFGLGGGVLSLAGDSMGKFAIDRVLETATVTQRDLKQSYYQGNSFDIGEYDASLTGVAGKAPRAIVAGLYQPFLWEANNAVMLFSALESTLFLLFTLLILRHLLVAPKRFFRTLFGHPLLVFMLSYTLFFAAIVGLSTSNFGALVRFKIPFLPTFTCVLFALEHVLTLSKQAGMRLRKEEKLSEATLQKSL
jgi:hypothetical protein